LGEPNTPDAKDRPVELIAAVYAATPSAALPDRSTAVSEGPAAVAEGAQPADGETSAVPAAQAEQAAAPL